MCVTYRKCIVNIVWLFSIVVFSTTERNVRCSFHISNTVVAAAAISWVVEWTVHIFSIRYVHARLRLVHGAGVDCNWKMVICYKWKLNFHKIDNVILHVMRRVCIKIYSFSNRFAHSLSAFPFYFSTLALLLLIFFTIDSVSDRMLGLTIQTLGDGDMVIEIHKILNKFEANAVGCADVEPKVERILYVKSGM